MEKRNKSVNAYARFAHSPALICVFVDARDLFSKIDLLRDYALKMKLDVIGVATRENNILDLIISADVNLVTELTVLEHLGSSDHNI